MVSRHHLGLMKTVPLCAAVLALPLAAGCSASDASDGKTAKPATLAELAKQTDCSVTGKRKVKDLEQGNCKTSQGRFVLLSFTTDKGMHAWLEEAKPWGGVYLVGARWVVVSQQKTLEGLRKDLGGKIVHGDDHGTGGGGGHGSGHG
ncbi:MULTISPECIES: hypothetical protein [Actinomadura]|uniref:Lipoprotein n=1 Tax=Actinomadura madurae TaxID=1993 RepID=A0A1I4XED8_9ACTN|nr:hypothetical protein [Actinomadura madurae]SFN23680.1 hypothetical protein SAMN04489713_101820 [Actinomadura madurae]SPT63438.1 Uncharacterised protein [Actinomadura madurae]